MKHLGVLTATAVLGATLVMASTPAEAFRGGGFHGGGFHGGGFHGGFGRGGWGGRGWGWGGGLWPYYAGLGAFGLGYGLGAWDYGYPYDYDYAYYGYPYDYYGYSGYPYDYYGYSGYPYGNYGYSYPGYAYAPAPVVTGRSVATGAFGNYCTAPARTCLLKHASYVGGGCACRVSGGYSRGHVVH
ncbi:MAG TPA: hypothetical protein VME69_00055 [Methylocella sp.]|nr:hypothetical protein [Methylocella sp.]